MLINYNGAIYFRKMFLKSVLTFLLVLRCGGATYHKFNESAYYEQMPPLFGLDDYYRCLRPNDGIYCMVRVSLQAGSNEELLHNIQEYSRINQHFNHTIIDRGVCVSKKCKTYMKNETLDLEWTLGACLNDSIHNEYGLEAKVSQFLCERSNEKTVIDASDWIVVACIGFIVMINIVGSLYHYFQKEDALPGHSLILCFSVFKNWEWLTCKNEKSKNPQLSSFQGLHGVRTISIILMILPHAMIPYGSYIDNEHLFEQKISSYWIVANGGMLIQLFFVMTGMLLAFKIQMLAEKSPPLSWSMVPKMIFYRWLRLTPPYAMMLALSATWLRHMGSGPLWRAAVVETTAADCRRYWWHHVLYFNNYMGDVGKHCAVQTWYVPADMQLFALGVVVLIGTQARGRVLALVLMVATGVIAPALQVWKDGLEGAMLLTPEMYRTLDNKTFYRLHILGHNNMAAFGVGMSAAVALYRMQKYIHIKKYKKTRSYTIPAVSMVTLCVLVIYSGCALFLARDQPLWMRVGYQGLHRLVFSALALAVAFLGLRDETIRKVIEWDGWIVPSRLCYSVYIVHMLFISFFLGSKTQLAHMSLYNLISTHMSIVCLSFMMALPLCLAVEAPMIAVVDRLKRGGRPVHDGDTKVLDKTH